MSDRINLVQTLKEDIERLRRVMARDIKVGSSYPGESQVQSIQTIIAELERIVGSESGLGPLPNCRES